MNWPDFLAGIADVRQRKGIFEENKYVKTTHYINNVRKMKKIQLEKQNLDL